MRSSVPIVLYDGEERIDLCLSLNLKREKENMHGRGLLSLSLSLSSVSFVIVTTGTLTIKIENRKRQKKKEKRTKQQLIVLLSTQAHYTSKRTMLIHQRPLYRNHNIHVCVYVHTNINDTHKRLNDQYGYI